MRSHIGLTGPVLGKARALVNVGSVIDFLMPRRYFLLVQIIIKYNVAKFKV